MDGYLPAWLIALITLAGSTAITTTIGLIIKRYFKKYIDKKDAEIAAQKARDAELAKFQEEKQRQERKKDVLDSVKEIMKPIVDKIDALDEKLSKVEDGTLSTLRNDILTCYYRCSEKGYRNDYDYQNIHHMYDSYAELHGNSYVADIMDRFDALPTKEEFREAQAKKAKATKKGSTKKNK